MAARKKRTYKRDKQGRFTGSRAPRLGKKRKAAHAKRRQASDSRRANRGLNSLLRMEAMESGKDPAAYVKHMRAGGTGRYSGRFPD